MACIVYVSAFEDMTLEKKIFEGLDATLLAVPDLHSPESREIMRQADVLIVTLHKVTADVLDAMPNCKLISRVGVGIDSIDVSAATARGIWVANVPDYGVDEVATHAITLALTQLRGVHALVNVTRNGGWDSRSMRPIQRLTRLTLGVVGFGRIGRAAGKKGAGVGMRVIAYDPFLSDDAIRAAGAEPATLDTLFREADVITLHLPLNAETKHIVNARALKSMKPDVFLVNTSRGGLIDEAALLDALNNGEIRGAALDVLSSEPPAPDDPVLQALLKHEKVLVTPHVAWYSEQAQVDMRTGAAEDVARVLRGERPRTPVNEPTQKASGA